VATELMDLSGSVMVMGPSCYEISPERHTRVAEFDLPFSCCCVLVCSA
jgi:hypothetical protein